MKQAQHTLVATALEPDVPKDVEEDEEEGSSEILVEVEEGQETTTTDPPIFQLENLENLQFVADFVSYYWRYFVRLKPS